MDDQTLEHINHIIERLSKWLDNAEKTRQNDRNAIWQLQTRVGQLEYRIESLERMVER